MAKRIKMFWRTAPSISGVAVLACLLGGCMSPGKHMLPHGDMTMSAIYAKQTGSSVAPMAGGRVRHRVAADGSEYWPGSETVTTSPGAATPVTETFQVLPNPSIAVYIFPHLSTFGETTVPVPGYETAFFLYTRNHYAMPSEQGVPV